MDPVTSVPLDGAAGYRRHRGVGHWQDASIRCSAAGHRSFVRLLHGRAPRESRGGTGSWARFKRPVSVRRWRATPRRAGWMAPKGLPGTQTVETAPGSEPPRRPTAPQMPECVQASTARRYTGVKWADVEPAQGGSAVSAVDTSPRVCVYRRPARRGGARHHARAWPVR